MIIMPSGLTLPYASVSRLYYILTSTSLIVLRTPTLYDQLLSVRAPSPRHP